MVSSDGRTPVVAYERISSDATKDAHGVEDQHRVNEETAASLGWNIVHHYTDNDVTAFKADIIRDEFESMLKVLQAGRLPNGQPVHGVVVVADDRLVRRVGDYERFIDSLTQEEGRVYADAKGPKNLYNEDVESMGLFGVVIAKAEVRKIKRRVRRSHRRRAELGIPVGGTTPFGWKEDKVTLDPEQAELLAKAARDVIAGKGIRTILGEWQEADIRTVKGNPWVYRSLKLALWNPRICGWRKLNGELVRDAEGNPVVGKWDPIISTEEWMALDALFSSSRKGPKVRDDGVVTDYRTPSHLLTGILRCGKLKKDGTICNTKLRVTSRPSSYGGFMYQCLDKGLGGCGGIGRNGKRVDEYITEAVLIKLEERETRKQVEAEEETPGHETELERLVRKQRKMLSAWQDDLISDEIFFPANQDMDSRIKQIRKEKAKNALRAERDAAVSEDLRTRWKNGELDLSQKRALIRETLHAVIVLPTAGPGRRPFDPDLLEIKWRND